LYFCDALLERLRLHLEDMAPELRALIEKEDAIMRQGDLPGRGRRPPRIKPTSEMVWCGARNGRIVTTAVRPPVRLATRWLRVVSSASARVMAGSIVAKRCAEIDVPALPGPMIRILGPRCPYYLQLAISPSAIAQ
jgi:hypothetical protein